MRRNIHGRDVDNPELAGLPKLLSQLITGAQQPFMLIRARAVHLALKARIEHFEIEDGELRIGGLGGHRPYRQQQQHEDRNARIIVTHDNLRRCDEKSGLESQDNLVLVQAVGDFDRRSRAIHALEERMSNPKLQ